MLSVESRTYNMAYKFQQDLVSTPPPSTKAHPSLILRLHVLHHATAWLTFSPMGYNAPSYLWVLAYAVLCVLSALTFF